MIGREGGAVRAMPSVVWTALGGKGADCMSRYWLNAAVTLLRGRGNQMGLDGSSDQSYRRTGIQGRVVPRARFFEAARSRSARPTRPSVDSQKPQFLPLA